MFLQLLSAEAGNDSSIACCYFAACMLPERVVEMLSRVLYMSNIWSITVHAVGDTLHKVPSIAGLLEGKPSG